MGLTGKMVKQIEIRAGGDVIHELYCKNQTGVAKITPGKVHGCDLHHGQRGDHGSIICWDYTHEGKRKKAKQHVEPDYENNTTKFTMLEGDLMELYKTFVITLSVEKHGEKDLVTWTTEYEKLNEDVEDPASLMDFFAEMTKDIEAHHLPKPAEAEAGAEAVACA
ncbi:hypothetical protein LIER_20572 [Lithospermum erythrorhizon]|uniref:Bet v I/Major latex protein domain-containing protein n=1 Tax=Lithospermum erythrorhizon TaxID=34254 RepID=A0AAV3QQ31_LITER